MALQLYIRCRNCNSSFKRHLDTMPTDLTIKCPFCSSFALALIDVSVNEKPRPGRRRRKVREAPGE